MSITEKSVLIGLIVLLVAWQLWVFSRDYRDPSVKYMKITDILFK